MRDPIALAMKSSVTPTAENSDIASKNESSSPMCLDDDAHNQSTMIGRVHNILSSAVQLKWNVEGERREAEKLEKTLHDPNVVQRRERSSVIVISSGGGSKVQEEHEM